MAIRKRSQSQIDAKTLKKMGLIKTDLRKKMSPQQKGAITRKVNGLKSIPATKSVFYYFREKEFKKELFKQLEVANLMGNRDDAIRIKRKINGGRKFDIRYFDKKHIRNKQNLQKFKDAGYAVIGNSVYIPLETYGMETHVKNQKSPLTGNKVLVFETYRGQRKMLTFVESGINLLTELQNADNKKLPQYSKVMAAIGENNPFKKEFFSYSSLEKYMATMKVKDKEKTITDLVSFMSLVTIER